METIGAFDAKTRLSELLARTARGEEFEITKHGRPVGRLMPPATAPDRQAIAAAVERLLAMKGIGGKMSREELKAMIHEGHRY
jgi:prevent-host-death family protein